MTISNPVEIELKLALPPQQAVSFLQLMRRRSPPGQQELITRYFDTPAFALSEQGVALRVRRAGRRWVQTLKTEGVRRGGLSQRAEYEMTVTRGSPDWTRFSDEALARVPEALREQLVPVFETRFTRTAWQIKSRGAHIEVALDVGEVRAGANREPICEIELELKAGGSDALFALAQGWAEQLDCVPLDISKAERGVRLALGKRGAPVKAAASTLDDGMTVEEGFAAICQACLAQFQGNLPGVLASDDIEYVHQARVALRRLRAALRLYRGACALPDGLMGGLRTLAGALGSARDWDVLCAETLPAIAPHYANLDAWQRGTRALEMRRAEVRARMQAALTEARPGAWLLAMQRWLLQQGWRAPADADVHHPAPLDQVQLSPLKKWARRALDKGHRHIIRGAGDFGQLDGAQRHALRIAVKRQRYGSEFFQTLFNARSKRHKGGQARYLAALQGLQDSLGRSNDAQVASGLLNEADASAGSMMGFVLGWLAAEQAMTVNSESADCLQDFLKWKPYW